MAATKLPIRQIVVGILFFGAWLGLFGWLVCISPANADAGAAHAAQRLAGGSHIDVPQAEQFQRWESTMANGSSAAATPDAEAASTLLSASLVGPQSWSDPLDNAGLLDISAAGFGADDTTGSLFISVKFWWPSWLYDLGSSDCAWVQLDTDSNTSTGWNFHGTLGIDYIVSFVHDSSGFYAQVIRTPSDLVSTWVITRVIYADMSTLDDGQEAVGAFVSLADISNPANLRFIVYTSYLSMLGVRSGDFLPNQPGALSYHVYAQTTTTQPPTTTTTQPSTTTTLPSTTTTLPPTTTTLPSTTTTTLPHDQQFSDVPDSHPYAAQIVDLSSRGIINGFPNGTFQPDAAVTRQQFAKMIVKTLNLPVSESDVCPFIDVSTNLASSDPLYPDHYIAVCAAHGITLGKSATSFEPFSSITRAQLITMVSRSVNLADPPEDYVPPFASFDPTHYPFARRAAYAGVLNGLKGIGPNFAFLDPATRGEVCVLLYNVLHR